MSDNHFVVEDQVDATWSAVADSDSPSCDDAVTTACPICQHAFTPKGRQKFCSGRCRAAAYRARRDAAPPAVDVPKGQPRRPITVYECDGCGARALGEQRCETCTTFMRKIGLGGQCPHCEEPLAVNELAPGVIGID